MEITRVAVSEINPAPYNPRKDLRPEDPEYQQIKRSLEHFGMVEPLVWNRRTGNLVSGHQRFKILLESAPADVEVSVVDLSDDDEKALNVALNKLGGEFDTAKLVSVLADIEAAQTIPLDITGFNADDLTKMANDLGRPLFVPTPDAPIDTSNVTQAQVDAAQQRLDGRFSGPRSELRDVRCPDCGSEFQISP